MTPTSCFTGQVHRLPDAPQAYGAMITRPKAAPAQSRSTDLSCVFQTIEHAAVLIHKPIHGRLKIEEGSFVYAIC